MDTNTDDNSSRWRIVRSIDRRPIIILTLVFVLLTSLPLASAALGDTVWSHSHHDDHVSNLKTVGDSVYTTSNSNEVIAASAANGDKIWESNPLNENFYSIFGLDANQDTVLVGGSDSVVALNRSTGEQLWNHSHHSDTVYEVELQNGVAYSASADGTVIASDAGDGGKLWEHTFHSGRVEAITVLNGTVYSGATDNTVIAVDADTQNKLWEHSLHADDVSGLTAEKDSVFSVDESGGIIAADVSDGSQIWDQTSTSQSVYSVAVDSGTVITGGSTDVAVLNSTTGALRWTHDKHGSDSVYGVDRVGDVVYSGARDQQVFAVDATTQSPTLSDANPDAGTTVTESPVELSINVSDADFGTSQSDSVNVTFYDASDDSQIGSDTLTANATATTSWGSIQSGANDWYAVATDEYGNDVTSQTFTFNAPADLQIRALDTKELITEDANGDPINVQVQFFGDGGAVAQRNTTDGTISLDGLPADERFAVTVDAGQGYADRQILIPSLIEQQTAYLLNTSGDIQTVEPRFSLEDPSNQFDTEESEILLERPIELNGTTQFVPIAGDRIGLNGFDTILEAGQRYRVTVRDPESGATRRLGEFTATASELVTLTVQDVEFDSVADISGLDWTARYLENENDADEVEFIYRDTFETESLEYEIYERGNESNVLVQDTATGNVTVREPIPPDQANTVWVVNWQSTRATGETLSATRQVSTGRLSVGPGLAPEWQTAIAVVGLFVVAGLFGGVNPGVGGIAVASTGGFFWMLGWMPGSTTGLMVLLAFFIAVLSYAARQARGATA